MPILSYLRESCKRIGNIHSRYAHTVIPRFAVEKRLLGLEQELLIPLTTFDHKFLSYFRFSLLTSPRIRCFFSFLLLMAIQTNSSSFGGQPAIVPHQAELLAELVASVDLEELCDAFHSKVSWRWQSLSVRCLNSWVSEKIMLWPEHPTLDVHDHAGSARVDIREMRKCISHRVRLIDKTSVAVEFLELSIYEQLNRVHGGQLRWSARCLKELHCNVLECVRVDAKLSAKHIRHACRELVSSILCDVHC